jgi:hypothetical protein
MTVNIHIEHVLCNEKMYNNMNEVIAGHCFIVDSEWLMHMWKRHFKSLFDWKGDFDDFLDCYDYDYEGQIMYLTAKQQNKIIDEGYEVVYED